MVRRSDPLVSCAGSSPAPGNIKAIYNMTQNHDHVWDYYVGRDSLRIVAKCLVCQLTMSELEFIKHLKGKGRPLIAMESVLLVDLVYDPIDG